MDSIELTIFSSESYTLHCLDKKDEMLIGSPCPLTQYIDALLDDPTTLLFGIERDFLQTLQ